MQIKWEQLELDSSYWYLQVLLTGENPDHFGAHAIVRMESPQTTTPDLLWSHVGPLDLEETGGVQNMMFVPAQGADPIMHHHLWINASAQNEELLHWVLMDQAPKGWGNKEQRALFELCAPVVSFHSKYGKPSLRELQIDADGNPVEKMLAGSFFSSAKWLDFAFQETVLNAIQESPKKGETRVSGGYDYNEVQSFLQHRYAIKQLQEPYSFAQYSGSLSLDWIGSQDKEVLIGWFDASTPNPFAQWAQNQEALTLPSVYRKKEETEKELVFCEAGQSLPNSAWSQLQLQEGFAVWSNPPVQVIEQHQKGKSQMRRVFAKVVDDAFENIFKMNEKSQNVPEFKRGASAFLNQLLDSSALFWGGDAQHQSQLLERLWNEMPAAETSIIKKITNSNAAVLFGWDCLKSQKEAVLEIAQSLISKEHIEKEMEHTSAETSKRAAAKRHRL